MKSRVLTAVVTGILLFAAIIANNRLSVVYGQKRTPGEGFAAIPGLKGGQDIFGPYDPAQNWPRPLAESLPNHERRGPGRSPPWFSPKLPSAYW